MTAGHPQKAWSDVSGAGLETPVEHNLARVVAIARRSFDVPIAIADGTASHGPPALAGAGAEYARDAEVLCDRARALGGVWIVRDASLDPHLRDLDLVRREGVRFVAGHRLSSSSGQPAGALCLLDRRERAFGPDDVQALADLAELTRACLSEADLERARREARERERQLEQAVRESDLFFDLSLDGFCIAGVDGYFKQLNPAWERMLGFDRSELLGRPFVEFVHPADREATMEETARLAAGEQTILFQNRYEHKAGGYRWILWTAVRGQPDQERIYAIARDITELKRHELDLERAKESAEAASRAKSEFLASMSHELRTPLNAVIGFANVALRDSELGNRVETDHLERIRNNALHLLTLINQVLDLSRVESGRIELELEDVELGELVRETVSQLSAETERSAVALMVELPSEPVVLRTDAGRLRQILINLVGNALKFTERGRVVVRLRVDGSGRATRLDVEDTGIGIPEEHMSGIFHAFEQVDQGTARRYEGTGLGLAISRSIAEHLGFRLEVHSRFGAGSTFSLVFTERSRRG